MECQLTELDINKDIKVDHSLHIDIPKIEVKYYNHLFRIYVKSNGRDTVCRAEKLVHSSNKKNPIEVINDIFNPTERFEEIRSN